MKCPKCESELIKTERSPDGYHVCLQCYNSWKNKTHQEKCKYCGEEIYYGQHVCREEIRHIKKAANDLWNSVTDLLTQSEINKIESLHREDIKTLGIF